MTTYTPKYLLATQSGKEAVVNENFQGIAARLEELAAAIGVGGGSPLTAEQLQSLFIDQTELSAILAAALAGIPSGGSGGASLADIQAELDSRPTPATVTDVQNAVNGLTVSAGGLAPGMAQLFYGTLEPMGFQRITPARDFSRSRINGGPALATVSTAGSAPATAVIGALVYSIDNIRGFYSYNPDTGDVVTLASPPMMPFSATQKPLLSTTGVLGADLLCVVSDTLNTSFAYFNATTGIWSAKTTITESLALSSLVPTGAGVLGLGGSGSTGYVARLFSGTTATALECTGGWPSSYYAPALSCKLPSGDVMVAMRPSAGAARAASYVLSSASGVVSLAAMASGLPSEVLNVVALQQTTYGAAALVTLNNTAAPYQYALALFDESAGGWTLLADRLGSTGMAATAALAVLGTDLGVVVFGPSNSGPAALLANLTEQSIPALFYAVKLP